MTVTGVLKAALILPCAVFLIVCVAMAILQRSVLYHPDRLRISPAAAGLGHVDEIEIKTPDGETLVAWLASAKPGRPTLLFAFGNGGSLAGHAHTFKDLTGRGYGLLMLAYRSYSGSTGRPTEANNVADGLLAYDELRRRGVAATDIILFGESLGTGIATQIAAQRPVAGLVLDSPYTSMTDAASRIYPWLPVRWLLLDRYETTRHIKFVKAPVLVIHGEADGVVPVEMGRAVRTAAVSPAEIATFPGAGHVAHRHLGSFDILERWITRAHAAAKGRAP